VQSPTNIGFARANNLGARQTDRQNLLLLNPDTEFVENSLPAMLSILDRLPNPGAIGPRLLNSDGTQQTSCVQSFPTVLNQLLDSEFLRGLSPRSKLWGMKPLYDAGQEPGEAEAISGACMLVRRECFERVGGFTESYFMYGEDLDLCFKLRNSGLRNYHASAIPLIHFGGGSSKQAASNFSTVMMRESVYRFISSRRGPGSAAAYRITTFFSALIRLVLIIPLLLLGDRVVRHGSGSLRKWTAILKWSLALAPKSLRQFSSPAKSPPASVQINK
jgi:GT2 family glycosyltransferase